MINKYCIIIIGFLIAMVVLFSSLAAYNEGTLNGIAMGIKLSQELRK